MTQPTDRTYLLIGHVTKDILANGEFTNGGTVTYGSVVAKLLDWRPVIITAAGPDFSPPPFLADVEWHILPSPYTTTFRNEYDAEGNRRQTIGPLAQPIRPVDIPAAYRQVPIVHLCPLNQEVPASITAIFEKSLLISTPQGWMRQWDEQGIVSRSDWVQADEVLPQITATVISIEDIEGDWTLAEQWAALASVLIVTQGVEGCTVFEHGERLIVPPRPANPVDPTGAGDVFATAFAIRLYETGNLWQSARFANVTASMAIERFGAAGAPSRAEVEAYLLDNPV
ncbi:MAG: hypothetical protein KDI79_10855 [Anaerolineae bacterium]|nr:hypothetical protein [Anaerolineae bacterium]